MPDAPPPRLGWQTRIALLTGLATLVALAVFLVRERGGARHRVHALVASANGVREGAPVSYLGVDVGRVERVAFVRDSVLLTMEIDPRREAPIRRGDAVRLSAYGIFGDQSVRIVPGAATAPLAASGDTLRGVARDTVAERVNEAMVEAIRRAFVDSTFRRQAATAGSPVSTDSAAVLRGWAAPVPLDVKVIPVPPDTDSTRKP